MKPFRSAQRVYMRSSISAQSWESVPPAPAWMATIAPRVVVLTREQQPELASLDLIEEAGDLGGKFLRHRCIPGLDGEVDQFGNGPDAFLEAPPSVDVGAEPREPFHRGLCGVGVVPEVGVCGGAL